MLDEILNRKPNKHLPYVGAAAFSHKGGLHVSAVQKDPKTYEHINPEEVGNSRNIIVSDQSGQSNIMSRLNLIGINIQGKHWGDIFIQNRHSRTESASSTKRCYLPY